MEKCNVRELYSDDKLGMEFSFPNGYIVNLTCKNIGAPRNEKKWTVDILECMDGETIKPAFINPLGVSIFRNCSHKEAVEIVNKVQVFPNITISKAS